VRDGGPRRYPEFPGDAPGQLQGRVRVEPA
jgi:hypothetical protein